MSNLAVSCITSKIRTIWWIWIPSFLTGYRSFDSICSSFYILPFPFKVLCLLRRFFLSKIIFVNQKGAAEPQHCLKICECELGLWFLIYWIYWWTYSLYSIYVHNGSRRVEYWQVQTVQPNSCVSCRIDRTSISHISLFSRYTVHTVRYYSSEEENIWKKEEMWFFAPTNRVI